MGVQGLWSLIQPVARPIQLETLEGRKLAIDSSIWLYHFRMAMRDKEGRTLKNAHILGFFYRILKLLFYGIRPVFVFDGQAPTLKRKTLVREGAKDAHAVTAKKLLNAQLRQAALKEVKSRSSTAKTSAGLADREQDDNNAADTNGLGENTVYFDDLDAPKTDSRGEGSRGGNITTRRSETEADDDEWMDEANEIDQSANDQEARKRSSNSRSLSPTKKPVKKNDYHRDPYALPEMDRDFSALSRNNGNNKRSKDRNKSRHNRQDIRFATETEQRELMSQLKPSDLDTTSSFFQSLPTELQYELLGDMRSQSRGTSYRRLQSMLSSAPTPIDFSKAQIDGLKTRNKLTQKVLEVSDSIGDAKIKIEGSRVSGERNREYVLIRNKDTDGIGYSLGIRDQGMSKEKAIEIDNSDDDDDDQEDRSRGNGRGNDSQSEEGMDFDQVNLDDENIRATTSDDDEDEDQGGLTQSQIDQARREGRMIADDPEKRLEILRKLRAQNLQKSKGKQKPRGMASRRPASVASTSKSELSSNSNLENQPPGGSLFLPEKGGSSSSHAIELEDEVEDDLDDDLGERGVGTSASRAAALGDDLRFNEAELGSDFEDVDQTLLQDQGFALEDFEEEELESLPTAMSKRKQDDQLDLDEMDDLERVLEMSRRNQPMDEEEEDAEMHQVEVGIPELDEKKSFETNDYEAALAALDDTNSASSRSPPPLPSSDYSSKRPTNSTLNSFPRAAQLQEKESQSQGIELSLEARQESERERARQKQLEKMRKGREYENFEEQERLEIEEQKQKSAEKERSRLMRAQREKFSNNQISEQAEVVTKQIDEQFERPRKVGLSPQEQAQSQRQDESGIQKPQAPSAPTPPQDSSQLRQSVISPPSPSVEASLTPASKVFDEITGSPSPNPPGPPSLLPSLPAPDQPSTPPAALSSSNPGESDSRLRSNVSIETPTKLGSRRNAGAGAKAKIKYVSEDDSVGTRPEEIEAQPEISAPKIDGIAQEAAGVAQGDEYGEVIEEDSKTREEGSSSHESSPQDAPSPQKDPIRKSSSPIPIVEVEMKDGTLSKAAGEEGLEEIAASASATLDNVSSREAESIKPAEAASNKRVRVHSPTSLRNPNIQYDSDSGTPFSDSDDDQNNQVELGPDGFPMPTAEELAAMEAEDLEELGGSKEDFASFLSKSRSVGLSEAQEEIEREVAALKAEHANTRRTEEDITLQMAAEVQTMLRLFGIPFITAPAEAEAQCAELVILKLVDGIITDDSDVFCFGGNRVYKNMFNQNKIVECFLLSDLQRELGIDREKLVQLAYLLGSDYTEGLPGVGPVLAMEILALFDDQDGLINFRDWWVKVQEGSDSQNDTRGKTMKKIKKTLRNKVHLEPHWPDPEVLNAYYEPKVDNSDEPFTWGLPDLDGLRTVLKAFLGWDQDKADHHLLPVIESQRRRNKKKQSTLDRAGFFDTTGGLGAYSARQAPKYKSSRLQEVVQVFRNKKKADRAGSSGTASATKSSPSKAIKKRPVKGSKKSRQAQEGGDDLFSASDQDGEHTEGDSSDGFEMVDEAALGRTMGATRPIVRRDEDEQVPQSNLDRNIEALEGELPQKAPTKRKRGGGGATKAKGKGKAKEKVQEGANSEGEEDEVIPSDDEHEAASRPKSSRARGRGAGRGRGRGTSRGGASNKARLRAARNMNLDEVDDEVNLDVIEDDQFPKARPKPRAVNRNKKSYVEEDEDEEASDNGIKA